MVSRSSWSIAGGSLVALLAAGVALGVRSTHAPTPSGASLGLPEEDAAAGSSGEQSPGSPQEGIEVHGHWRIEVRNPDGTTVSVREFQNAIVPEGANSLARFLGRVAVPGYWRIRVWGSPAICLIPQTEQAIPCDIVEAAQISDPQPPYFGPLTISVPAMGEGGADTVVLSGNATAMVGGSIVSVGTELARPCAQDPSSTIGEECSPGVRTFSGFTLDSPIPVQAGQSILATVTFSFS